MPQSCSSRMPGVSITSAPVGVCTSSRRVVVWRPLLSFSRTSAVGIASGSRTSELIRLDFPTPEEPMNANVRPGCAYVAASAFSPFRVAVLVIKTGTPGTSTSISLRTVSASVHTSDLFNTTTASAPLSFAATRNR